MDKQTDDADGNDEFLWLEEIEGEKALAWVESCNQETLQDFESDPNFQTLQQDALAIMEAEDKIPWGVVRNGLVYNFWQDSKHVRGIWRRTTLSEYKKAEPDWELVLDIDQLAADEDENWVWRGPVNLPPDYSRCMVMLSIGGKDAIVAREFDLQRKCFVEDGFYLPEAKSRINWLDQDHLLVATDFGEGSMTDSGYPARMCLWQRGQALKDAQPLLEVERNFLAVGAGVQVRPEARYVSLHSAIDFYHNRIYLLDDNLQQTQVNLPEDVDFQAFFQHQAIAILRSDWRQATQGSLIALHLESDELTVIHQPTERVSLVYATTIADRILFSTLENVSNVIYEALPDDGQWRVNKLPFADNANVGIFSTSDRETDYFVTYNDFLTPPSLLAYGNDYAEPELMRQQAARFDASGLKVEQHFATSADGTQVPYFLIGSQAMPEDGSNPVLLYGYGGFEVPLTPGYNALTGKLWLERGGCYVLANIRGGGEFGPSWHQAALKNQRHKAFEDFIAIAEDLIQRDITSPENLAISGGSNGGLLVGATFTQRPELFAGVICSVPLLDMLRYHKLLAGASWTGEYGDPEDEEMHEYLAGYSPYHQLRADKTYPPVFFVTSTRDDRVHPGHARKMVARMQAQGHPVHYYENTEGGHSAGANLKQHARLQALEYVYLERVL